MVQQAECDRKVLKVTTVLKVCKKVALVPDFILCVSDAVAQVFTAGGLPPLVNNPDIVYWKTFGNYVNLGICMVN